MTDKDNLGNRMKDYERAAGHVLPARLPVMLRVDGKCFSQYTKGCDRPFDQKLIEAMWEIAKTLCTEIQGAQLAYVQSDEISVFIHNYKMLTSQAWRGNKVQKMCSIAAGIASSVMTLESKKVFGKYKRACFDARVWVLPEAEVCNSLIFRQQDWTRNSVQMLARSLFSHNQCYGKNNSELQDLCMNQGRNWNDLPTYLRRGACIIRKEYKMQTHIFSPEEGMDRNKAFKDGKYTVKSGEPTIRSRWEVDKKIPIFTQDRDYIDHHLKVEDE